MNALLPHTTYRNSLPDLLLLVKPVQKAPSLKMNALLPHTTYRNSPPVPLLPVNAEQSA